MAQVLRSALTGVFVVEAVTVTTLSGHERVPDVSVVRHEAPVGAHLREVPLLVVEVLSALQAGEDVVGKSTDSFSAGVEQYWLVDPAERSRCTTTRPPGGHRLPPS